MARTGKDRSPALLAVCLALTLSGALIRPPRAQALSPKVTTAGVTSPTAAIDDDGDGDELLEHWDNAKYIGEQRMQLAGLVAFLAGCGALSHRRRAALRRACRHE